MRPSVWHPPVALSLLEQSITKRIKRAKLFTFLRRVRHELFSDTFQQELAELYEPSLQGQPPIPPACRHACPHHDGCTKSTRGRHVSIHPDERLLEELRERQQTPQGRAKLRERVAVEHSLAHVGHWQGPRARYLGERKNLFDLRRTGVVHNLHVLQHLLNDAQREAA